MILKLEPLDTKNHDRKNFDCGNSTLNDYLSKRANQDIKNKLASTYVMAQGSQILGYYSLCMDSVSREKVPEGAQKKLAKYPYFPTVLLGRLAVDKSAQGQGLGEYLLVDALKRVLKVSEIFGCWAVQVDPIDEDAKAFYQRYGFIELHDSKRMFIPVKSLEFF